MLRLPELSTKAFFFSRVCLRDAPKRACVDARTCLVKDPKASILKETQKEMSTIGIKKQESSKRMIINPGCSSRGCNMTRVAHHPVGSTAPRPIRSHRWNQPITHNDLRGHCDRIFLLFRRVFDAMASMVDPNSRYRFCIERVCAIPLDSHLVLHECFSR